MNRPVGTVACCASSSQIPPSDLPFTQKSARTWTDFAWRYRWDLNPRCVCTHTTFRELHLRPLGHDTEIKITSYSMPTEIVDYSVIVIWSTLKKSSIAGKPIVNINNASPTSITTATKVFANFPPGSLLQIQEYIFIPPGSLAWQLWILALDHMDELPSRHPTKSNDVSNPSEGDRLLW